MLTAPIVYHDPCSYVNGRICLIQHCGSYIAFALDWLRSKRLSNDSIYQTQTPQHGHTDF